jgi:hypothetical protein
MGLIKVVKRPIPCQAFIIRISTPEAVMANSMQSINTSRLGMGILVGAVLALSGCKPQVKEAATNAAPATGNQIAISLPNPAPNTLPVPPNPPGTLPIVPLKALEPIQPAPGRLSQPLKTSTRDPFSAVLPNQLEQPLQSIAPKRILTKLANKAKTILQPKAKSTKIAAAPVKPKQAIQPKLTKPAPKPQPAAATSSRPQVIAQPAATTSSMPQVNIAPIPAPPAIMPSPIAIAPAPAPVVSLVDQVEITGVAQVGNQLLVVARGPGESSARTIAPGGYLAAGRILVKAVRQEGKDPVVVLVENGVETVRSVSGARAMSMR